MSVVADLMLFVQIWPLRKKVTNVFVYGCAGIFGPATVVTQLYVVHSSVDHTSADHVHDLWEGAIGKNSATWQLLCSSGVLLLVGSFFMQTELMLMLHAIFRHSDKHVLQKHHTPHEKKHHDMTKIQSASRRYLSNKVREKTGTAGRLTTDQEEAATKIQAVGRGRFVRKGPMPAEEVDRREKLRQERRMERGVACKGNTTKGAGDVENSQKVTDTEETRWKRQQKSRLAHLDAEAALYREDQKEAKISFDGSLLPGSTSPIRYNGRRQSTNVNIAPSHGGCTEPGHSNHGAYHVRASRRGSIEHKKPTSTSSPASHKYVAPLPVGRSTTGRKKATQGASLAGARRTRRASLDSGLP